jgi:general secretion pathway protein A
MILSLILIILLLGIQGALALSDKEYFNKASASYIMGNLDEALDELQAALKINPKNAGALELQRIILKERPIKAPVPAAKPKPGKDILAAGISLFEKRVSSIPAEVAAYSALSVFFVLLVLVFAIVYRRTTAKGGTSICFNCKAKLPPNEEVCPYCGTRAGLQTWHIITEEQKLWYGRVGWKKNPFTMDIHPELFAGYKNEVKTILEKIRSSSGHILITGPLGIGKTTLLRWLTLSLPAEFYAIYIARPPQEFDHLTKFIMESLGFPESKSNSYYEIYNIDKLRRKIGKRLVLLMDEAHEFTVEIEKPLRTLGDLDGVTLVMAGLTETVSKLKNEIQPLYERLILEISLKHLEFEDLKDLIKARITDAGGRAIQPFTSAALKKIYESSKGIPRVAIKLCDTAVTKAIKQNEDKIDAGLIDETYTIGT